MFEFIDGYDVQATRKEAREEGIQEATKKFENEKKQYEEEINRLQEKIRALENKRT